MILEINSFYSFNPLHLYVFSFILHASVLKGNLVIAPEGGATIIYSGTECATLWGDLFQAENEFWDVVFGKITYKHTFWGINVQR